MDNAISWLYNQDMICFSIKQLIGRARCDELLGLAESRGFAPTAGTYPPGYRNNDRLVWDDAVLAADIFAQLKPHLSTYTDDLGSTWRPVACNSRFRFCRYSDGQSFTIHRDGPYIPTGCTTDAPARRTWLTVQVYLNGQECFVGGRTRFYASQSGGDTTQEFSAQTGMAIVFEHSLWHDGEAVPEGTKYVMRTDVLFERSDTQVSRVEAARAGYIWALAIDPQQRLVSAGRDGEVRIWDSNLGKSELLYRHEGSVTALLYRHDNTLFAGTRTGEVYRDGRIVAQHTAAITSLGEAGATQDGVLLTTAAGDVFANSRLIAHHEGWAWSALHIPGQSRVVSVGDDGCWMSGEQGGLLPHLGARRLAWFNGRLWMGDASGLLVEIDLTTRAIVSREKVHQGAITSLTAVGEIGLVTTSEDGTACWIKRRESAIRSTVLHSHSDFATCAVVIGNRTVATGGYDGRILVSELPVRPAL